MFCIVNCTLIGLFPSVFQCQVFVACRLHTGGSHEGLRTMWHTHTGWYQAKVSFLWRSRLEQGPQLEGLLSWQKWPSIWPMCSLAGLLALFQAHFSKHTHWRPFVILDVWVSARLCNVCHVLGLCMPLGWHSGILTYPILNMRRKKQQGYVLVEWICNYSKLCERYL